ncbi:MAG: hypothetical protein EXR62_05175 [Chloroflexi bacterium]|nr:hypothetical protein [Chloroflexota bacterium]
MINFPRSTFTRIIRPWKRDPYYKYPGGFVGKPGEIYPGRRNLVSSCVVQDEKRGTSMEMFVSAPCRTEYTIAYWNLFQVPSSEFRYAFSRENRLSIARRPSNEQEAVSRAKLTDTFSSYKIDIRTFSDVTELKTGYEIVEATLANDVLNARSTYRDVERGLTVSVEYPINLINLNEPTGEFQVCTGPLIVPDLATWDGHDVDRVFLAHVAIADFERVEFILRREVEAAESEREWLDKPVGRDRYELADPNNRPPNYPPARPRPTVYNEVWAFPATNVVMRAPNK